MELISAVNEQIIEKVFELVIPPALHNHCCLDCGWDLEAVAESKSLKTDQDNALIIQDGLEWHQCQSAMNDLTHVHCSNWATHLPRQRDGQTTRNGFIHNKKVRKQTLTRW